MHADIVEECSDFLAEYAGIPLAFAVESVLRVETANEGLGGFHLIEEPAKEVHVKDYDDYEDEGPSSWARRWDLSHWGLFSARLTQIVTLYQKKN